MKRILSSASDRRFQLSTNRNQNNITNYSCISHISEQEIIELQDVFLSYGFHYLHVETPLIGRELVATFIDSFNHYSSLAYLTVEPIELPVFLADVKIVSLHDEMAFCGALAFAHGRLESFLLESFCYDFVWIECTHDLLDKPWFDYFEQKLIEYNLAASIPVLFISYQNESN